MSAILAHAEDLDMTPDDVAPEPDESAEGARPSESIPARTAFALGVVYLLLMFLAARQPMPGGQWGAALLVAVFVFLPVAIIYHGVRIPLGAGVEAVGGLISLAVWLGLIGLDSVKDAALIVPAASVALLATCLFVGMLASRMFRERNILLPALIVAAAVDIVSVGWGFTGHALAKAPDLVAKLSVAVPRAVPPTTPGGAPHFGLLATMGIGDFFFLALFFAAAARFGFPLRRTFWCVLPLVLGAMLLTVSGVLPWGGVPGLPFIAVGFLAANFREFKLSPTEKRHLALVAVIFALFVVAMFAIKAYVA